RELQEAFGTHVLRDCKKPVVLPATTLDKYRMRTFTTVTRCGLPASADNALYAADVAMASSAGPLYFPALQVGSSEGGAVDRRTYVDGGIWANTPSLAGMWA